MPTKPIVNATTLHSQRDNRYLATCFDQHKFSSRFPNGRPWWGWREKAANRDNWDLDGFNSSLWPGDTDDPFGSDWEAPWLPETRFFEFDYRKNKISIRYERIILELSNMTARYYKLCNRACAKNGWATVTHGETPKDAITDIYGDPPMSPRIAEAARASHPWILGFNPEPDEELAKLLGISVVAYGITNAPKKAPVLPLEQAETMTDEDLDARIARIVAASMAQAIPTIVQAVRAKPERTPKQKAHAAKLGELARQAREAKGQTAGVGTP